LRDTIALPVDRRYDLVHYADPQSLRETAYALRAVDKRSNLLRVGNVLEEAALDKYSFTRDAYLQRRRAEVFDHDDDREVPPPLPADAARPAPADAAPAAPAAPAPGAPAAPAGQPQPAPAR
jgi:phospholipid-binding lipoprotein MlaA